MKKAVIVTAWIQKGRGQLRSAHGPGCYIAVGRYGQTSLKKPKKLKNAKKLPTM
jgi:hypothetical protein